MEQKLPDQNTGRDEKTIKVGRKNLQLLAETEVTDQFVSLPLVRILRDGSGRFEAIPRLCRPASRLSASGSLTAMLRRLIEILDEKSTVFTREQQQRMERFRRVCRRAT